MSGVGLTFAARPCSGNIGSQCVIYRAAQRADADSWLVMLTTRRNKNVAAVAMPNKTAQTVWALLAHGREFSSSYAAV